MTLRPYVWTVCLAIPLAAGLCEAQMLPPALCVPYDDSAAVVPAAKARAALAAFRAGDLRSVAQNLVGRSSFIVDPEKMPALARGTSRLSRTTTVEPPDGFSEEDLEWIDALGAFFDGDDGQAVQAARRLQPPGRPVAQSDRLRLETLVFLRRNMLPFAAQAAEQLKTSDNPADKNLVELAGRVAGAYRLEKPNRWLRIWEAEGSDSLQTPAIEFEFDGKLAVERQANETSPARRYRIVYRDLSGPPLVIAVCGPEMPDKQALVESIRFPQYGLDTFLLYPEEHEHSCTRVQLESLYAYSADLAPLAAGWIYDDPLFEPDLESDPILYEEVIKPLQERKAWNWVLRDRFGAGELNGLEVDRKRFGEGDAAVETFDFRYGPDGPPTWEVMAWENYDAQAADLADEPLRLEHMHFAVGIGYDRRHVASFRVVSEPAGNGRLYYLESLVNRQPAILDLYGELPEFDAVRDRVRAWVDAWPRPGAGGAMTRVDFDRLDASQGSVPQASVVKYLARYGITIEAAAETPVAVMSAERIYEGKAAVAVSAPNVLTQTGPPTAISYRMKFDRPIAGLRFTRVGLIASTSSGITHPQWSAEAYDKNGERLDSVGEELLSSYEDVPSREFTLQGPGIESIVWKSDARRFAAFSAVVVDNLEFGSDRSMPSPDQKGSRP